MFQDDVRSEQNQAFITFLRPRPLDLANQLLAVVQEVILAMTGDGRLLLAPELARGGLDRKSVV